eukprot:SAG11_NODE_24305_length_375_cov_0.931159_1_plen_43_part_01
MLVSGARRRSCVNDDTPFGKDSESGKRVSTRSGMPAHSQHTLS